jgi:cell division protease FtsH
MNLVQAMKGTERKMSENRNQGSGGYPNQNGDYPNGNGNYSNGNSNYPNGNGNYPNGNGNYPNGNGNYPNGNGNYPKKDNGGGNNNGNNNGGNGGGDNNKKNNRIGIAVCCVIAILAVLILNVITSKISESANKEISYKHFLYMLNNNAVAAVEVDKSAGKIVIYPKTNLQSDGTYVKTYYTGLIDDAELVDRLDAAGVDYTSKIPDTGYTILEFFAVYVLPFIFIWGAFIFIYRSMSKGGGIMGVGKSNAKIYMEKETGVTFNDVAGQEEAKESVTEMVDFLHNPGKYTKIGAKLPKGALLVGPPGTGKTLLAKAVAGEAKVPFFSLSGSDFVEMFVGVGASRVRDLFKQAQQQAPCIIFIDEIDAIGKSRDSHYGGGNDEREQTLNQLLSEMDGFDTSKGLVILAATNRPEVLDKALLRPGRFDRRIIVDKPDLKGRIDILKVHAKNVSLDETVNFEEIAMATSGAVGSDLANMVNEAAIMAVKAGRQAVSQADLLEAVEVVIAGKEKKDRILSKKEKKIVSYHEVGHALVAALQKNSEPVQKITIVPRTMGALGYVMQVPEEEKYLMSKDEMITEITTFCGGRAAESIMFDSVTTGASNDIEKATGMARSMVTLYGMSDKFGMVGLESVENRYLDGRRVLNCSEVTAAAIDEEVMKIMKECYDKAKGFLEENKDVMDRLAEFLYEKETITGKEFMKIFREMKGLPEEEEKKEDEGKRIL